MVFGASEVESKANMPIHRSGFKRRCLHAGLQISFPSAECLQPRKLHNEFKNPSISYRALLHTPHMQILYLASVRVALMTQKELACAACISPKAWQSTGDLTTVLRDSMHSSLGLLAPLREPKD